MLVLALSLGLIGTSCSKATNVANAPPLSKEIEYAFTKENQHPEKLLIQVINAAQSTLDIAIYSLTNKDITNAIIDAKRRGVAVRIITDQSMAHTQMSQVQLLKQMKDTGIPIKENAHSGIMHLKVTIADKSVITTGSFNYSVAAATVNDEVLISLHSPPLAGEWSDEFGKMWNDAVDFRDLK
ncbi:phospholipase D family protein [Paenibacillus cremeus]|uniref:phospholipase D n=2 Tax=Paenibacillus cremeus TaxID=2163881 RepID=A0A559JRC6_9BACL|nr:phospholipase D family protein [Paenibacillus cremeus]